ncbi:MAG: arsenic efflux protein [Oscillospiraceae bacterium]|nr:arsenic efflux protein [Oscillospiraceae bacterium]
MSYILPSILNISAAHYHSSESNIINVLLEALIDSVKMLPFLFLAFLFMEFIEHKAGDKLIRFLKKTEGGAGGAFVGAAAGCVPQCGFSVAAANLYSGRIITMGTLIAVFISTSDEALPVLIAHPESIGAVWKLIAAKIIIAAVAGIIIDIVIKALKLEVGEDIEEICTESGCGCGKHGIWYSSLKHTLSIFVFILIVNVILGAVMSFAGEETVSRFLNGMGILQPVLSGIAGMIPNCAASVLITELYADGVITFGSALAGLCTGAGVGLAVLFRANRNIKENLIITGIIFAVGVLSGMIVNLF